MSEKHKLSYELVYPEEIDDYAVKPETGREYKSPHAVKITTHELTGENNLYLASTSGPVIGGDFYVVSVGRRRAYAAMVAELERSERQ